MVHLIAADAVEIARQHSLEKLLSHLPRSLHARARRYRFERDQYNFLIGRLLLLRVAKLFPECADNPLSRL
ncbi:MAG: hypothetical protein AAFO94_21975, partial [Bacteroidota bacterium]